MIFAELFDKELTALFLRFSSNHCHSRSIIREDVVEDIEIHLGLIVAHTIGPLWR
jgi:hypothetical protein